MSKDHWSWFEKKVSVDNRVVRVFFHERDVWFCHLGINVGSEQDGKGKKVLRPIVVMKKFNNGIFWGIPTTKRRRTGKYYFAFAYRNTMSSTAILSQIRLLDSKRLENRIGRMGRTDFSEMKKRLVSILTEGAPS
jgi:mRNA interferase MazF